MEGNSSPLSVLHVTRADNLGGSARSAYKIHAGVRNHGHTSRMLVEHKVTDDPDVGRIHGDRSGAKLLDEIGRQAVDRLGLQYLFYPSTFALARHPWVEKADVIQLYNTHGGYFTHRALPMLSRQRPIIWRLSDMWPLTGHCAYSLDCERWRTGCGKCPLLREYPALSRDTTRMLWKLKKRAYSKSNLVIVATNRWMEQVVRASPLLQQFPLYRIPNGIDTEIFRPIEKRSAKQVLGIPDNSKVVLFAENVAKAETWKGGHYVVPLMKRLAENSSQHHVLIAMGEGADQWPEGEGYQTVRIEFTRSDALMAIVHSAADLLIHPALVDNLCNVVLEALSCGTPVAAFDVGAASETVRHMETGYLARLKDEGDLYTGVRSLLSSDEVRQDLGRRGRETVVKEFSTDLQSSRFMQLYEDVVRDYKSGTFGRNLPGESNCT